MMPATTSCSSACGVLELCQVLTKVFTCLATGDAALLDDAQVAEWHERVTRVMLQAG